MINGVDFSTHSVYVIYTITEQQEFPNVSKDKIWVNDSNKEILFDFKLRVQIGGSGMDYVAGFWYVILPKSYDDYSIRCTLHVNETGKLYGGPGNDYTREYNLFN